MSYAELRIRNLRARAVMAPMRRPLATASGSITRAPLVLVDLESEEGVTGISYVFSPNPLALKPLVVALSEMLPLIKGARVAPQAIEKLLTERCLLLGGTGIITFAIAAIDMAAWDALGKAANLPLVRLWGGEARRIPAYNSTGLGLMGAERTAAEALELLEFGFTAIKLRLGYSTLQEDVTVTRAVRRAVGDAVTVMSDYNQCLNVPEAIRRGHALDDEGLYWIEEPVRADDYAGNAAITQALKTSVQIGENFWSSYDAQKALAAGASDLIMPDASKIGGATAWLRAAALAQAAAVPISSHLFPEISAHLLAVSNTAHFLEYVDWANPVLQQPLVIEGGQALISDRPGHGMAWDEGAIGKLLV
jgi:mandelate racemase